MAPVNIFKQGADEERAETARLVGLLSINWSEPAASWFNGFFLLSLQSSFVGAIAIGDLVKSTLGPKGMVGPGDTLLINDCFNSHLSAFFTVG